MTENNSEICNRISVKKTAKLLKKNNNFIILTHSSPDGDTLGAAFALFYALKTQNKRVAVLCPDKIPEKFRYFVSNTDMVSDEGAYIISVDVADKKLLGSLEEKYGEKINLAIDHHVSNTMFAQNLCLDSDASATCEVMFEVINKLGVKINDIIAKALYTGISTDTGCFKYQNVKAKTHKIAAALYNYNIKADEINRIMFDTKSRRLLELEHMVIEEAEFHFNDRCMLLTVTSEMQEKTGCSGNELETMAVLSRSVEGVICGVTVKQTEPDTFKISLRTYAPLNASDICKELGGGGHMGAAGATMKGTLQEVKESIIAAVGNAMEKIDAGTVAS